MMIDFRCLYQSVIPVFVKFVLEQNDGCCIVVAQVHSSQQLLVD